MMRVAPGKPQKGLSIQVLNFFTRFLARPLSRLCLHVLASQNQEVTA
jgi:hypothetical protein